MLTVTIGGNDGSANPPVTNHAYNGCAVYSKHNGNLNRSKLHPIVNVACTHSYGFTIGEGAVSFHSIPVQKYTRPSSPRAYRVVNGPITAVAWL